MFADLRRALSECHVKSDDKVFASIADADKTYLIRRAREALDHAAIGNNVEDNLKLVIQLANLARYKHSKEVAKVHEQAQS
jgi:hypothetical protein